MHAAKGWTHSFDGELARYADFIRQTKPVVGVAELLIPGDPKPKTRTERIRNGVPLPDDTRAAIVNTAREVGISEVSIQRATSQHSPKKAKGNAINAK